jgi:hypothetical protein
MHRVELKDFGRGTDRGFVFKGFLMHRVELKATRSTQMFFLQ